MAVFILENFNIEFICYIKKWKYHEKIKVNVIFIWSIFFAGTLSALAITKDE